MSGIYPNKTEQFDNAQTDAIRQMYDTPSDISPIFKLGTDRAVVLDTAKKCVCQDREAAYGAPEDNFKIVADLWAVYKGVEFSAHDVAILLTLLKIARIKSGQVKLDNYIDLAGYAACAGELSQRKNK